MENKIKKFKLNNQSKNPHNDHKYSNGILAVEQISQMLVFYPSKREK